MKTIGIVITTFDERMFNAFSLAMMNVNILIKMFGDKYYRPEAVAWTSDPHDAPTKIYTIELVEMMAEYIEAENDPAIIIMTFDQIDAAARVGETSPLRLTAPESAARP